jgi:hypothetical protein
MSRNTKARSSTASTALVVNKAVVPGKSAEEPAKPSYAADVRWNVIPGRCEASNYDVQLHI